MTYASAIEAMQEALGDEAEDLIAEARVHLEDMPPVIQRDYLRTALYKMEAMAKVLAALTAAQAAPEREWRCFHCDEVFTNNRCASLHFGRDEDSEPACLIKAGAEQGLLGALRDAEYAAADAQQAVANECTDAAKAYYAQATRHSQALRAAEEAGYERGLADAAPPSENGGAK